MRKTGGEETDARTRKEKEKERKEEWIDAERIYIYVIRKYGARKVEG